MSADVINLAAWRDARAASRPARVRVELPILVPSWPWGWLAPLVATVTIEQ